MKKMTLLLCLFSFQASSQYHYLSDPTFESKPFSLGLEGGGCDADPNNPFTNCGFEAGDLTGWVLTDLTTPYFPGAVVDDGATVPDGPAFNFFTSVATEGIKSFMTGFDGDGPGVIELAQDVTLPVYANTMTFDYRAAWDLTFGATQDRTFSVEVQPTGGGAALQSDLILTAAINDTNPDTGALSAEIDISAFAGQDVRIAFSWVVPENLTGPAQVTIDNVEVTTECVSPINPVGNCSFETGDLTDWTSEDLVTPLLAAQVVDDGFNGGFFTVATTDGSKAYINGFDGEGPGVIRLWQELTVIDGPKPMLTFDYRAGWDMGGFSGTLDRTFTVSVEPIGGGTPLQSDLILTAETQSTNPDTGSISEAVDLSAFTGQAVRVVFTWDIPEAFTGPGQFQLDKVSFDDGDLIFADGFDPDAMLP